MGLHWIMVSPKGLHVSGPDAETAEELVAERQDLRVMAIMDNQRREAVALLPVSTVDRLTPAKAVRW